MYVFLASLAAFACAYGTHAGGLLGLIGGAAFAFGLGLIVFAISIGICLLIRALTGFEAEELIPIIATLIVGILTIQVAFNGIGSGGGDCIDGGRYSEYSSC